MAARVEQLKGVPKDMPMSKPGGHLDWYDGKFPLSDCKVGEEETITLKVKITSVHSDKYSSSVGFEIKSVEKYQ